MREQPVTALLREFAGGDRTALDRLIPLLYPELQKLARGYLRNERKAHTLQPTALVHEAYARLVKQSQPDYQNRAHFMGVAAQVMRQILIDHARGRGAEKRGGAVSNVSFDEALNAPAERPLVIIAVDDALNELAKIDPLKARLIEMRFFGGMTAEDSAEALNLPVAHVRRQLRVGQAWLQRELNKDDQQRTSATSEPRERRAPAPFDGAQGAASTSRTAKRRARQRAGEPEGRSPSE